MFQDSLYSVDFLRGVIRRNADDVRNLRGIETLQVKEQDISIHGAQMLGYRYDPLQDRSLIGGPLVVERVRHGLELIECHLTQKSAASFLLSHMTGSRVLRNSIDPGS